MYTLLTSTCSSLLLLAAESAIPAQHSDSLQTRDGFTGNHAACNPALLVLLTASLFTLLQPYQSCIQWLLLQTEHFLLLLFQTEVIQLPKQGAAFIKPWKIMVSAQILY